ncbi:hypothetical protein ACFLYU_03390 [Candidatus Dependentiae bacterium]
MSLGRFFDHFSHVGKIFMGKVFLLFLGMSFSFTLYPDNPKLPKELNQLSELSLLGDVGDDVDLNDASSGVAKFGVLSMACKANQEIKQAQKCCASLYDRIDDILVDETSCRGVISRIDYQVVPELGSIESKLDYWIGPLDETIYSKIDEISDDDSCCQTVRSTIDRVIVPGGLSIESRLDHWVGPVAETVSSKLDIMESKIDTLGVAPLTQYCDELRRLVLTKGTIITNGSNAISSDGMYTMTANTQGCITIDADDVIIDLCGFTLTCTSADAVIEILPGHNNIEIINGKIEGKSDLTNDGILTGSACELVLIEDVKIFSCDNGLNFSGISASPIKDCKIIDCMCKACNKGTVLDYARKAIFENCQALNCIEAGFEQTNCQFNLFENCKALQTSNDDATKGAAGFSSSAGTGNLFTGCVAEGTSVTVSNASNDAIGFLLAGTEEETKIIDSIANSTFASIATSASAYGILLTSSQCLIENNRVCNTTGSGSTGVGVSGDGSVNLIVRNVAYQNDTNFSSGITNVHTGDLESYDTLDNISAPYSVYVCCNTVNSKVDAAVIPELTSIESKLDEAVIPELGSIESKLDVVVIPQLETIESKLDETVVPLESKFDEAVVDKVVTIESKLDVGVVDQVLSIESKIDYVIIPVISEIENLVLYQDENVIITNGTNTIVTDGLYSLTANVNGCVTIDADDVVIDLAGFTLTCTSADAVIEILPGHNNIEIINGKIKGKSDLTNDGILTGSACELVLIDDVKIFECDNGLNFNGTESNPVKDCRIRWSVFKSCNKGVLLNYTIKAKFLDCQALNCVQSGFDLTDCQFNVFDNCKALQTTNDEETGRAIGFSSNDGTGNLFRECVAEGTTRPDADFGEGAIGFLLTGSEAESKIIECIANSSVVEAGSGIAFGILLEPTLSGTDLAAELTDSYTTTIEVNYVNWSPCGDYVAIGGDNKAAQVLRFDGSSLSLIDNYIHGAQVNSVAWSPCGQYLAIGGQNGYNNYDARVLGFDGSTLSLIDSYDHGANIFSVAWSPSGQYLVIAGVETGGVGARVFRFDGSSLAFVVDVAAGAGSTFVSADWSPCGRYFAAGGVDGGGGSAVAVLEFDGKNTSALVQYSHGSGVVYSVDWSSCGKYVAMGGTGGTSGYEVRVLEFDASSPSLTPVANYDHGGTLVRSVSWSSCGAYLAMGGSNPTDTYDLRILEFDGSSLTAVAGYDHGTTVSAVDWARSGKYLVMGGNPGTGNYGLRVFEVMYAPDNCLLDSNEVCNASGGGQQGIGICGSGDTLYIKNVGFANDVNFNKAVYNVYGLSLLEADPKVFDNLWTPPYVN